MAHRRELFDLGMAEGEEREQLRDFEESVFADEPVAQAIPNFQATHKPVPKEPKPKGTIIIYVLGQCLDQGVRK